MFEVLRRVVASVFLLAIFFVWLYVGFLPWRSERVVSGVKNGTIAADALPVVLWDDGSPRLMARRMLLSGPYDPGLIDEYLRRSLVARPLYAPAWLERAELALREGDRDAADRYAEIPRVLWPTRRLLLWRLAMMRIRFGGKSKALEALRDYLVARPGDVYRVAAMARRLEPDPGTLIEAVVPSAVPEDREPEYYLWGFFNFSRRIKDIELAHEVWRRMPVTAKQKGRIVYPYINFMISSKQPESAMLAWMQLRGIEDISGKITNPGFEGEVLNGGFGWRVGKVKGVTWSRDKHERYAGAYSMRISFDGSENVNYAHIHQTLPVEPGRSYRLTGYWRGENITTRSGIFIDVRSLGGVKNRYVRTAGKRKTWAWQSWNLDIAVPEDSYFIVVRVRRIRTDALDNLIAGRVWLDNLKIEAVEVASGR